MYMYYVGIVGLPVNSVWNSKWWVLLKSTIVEYALSVLFVQNNHVKIECLISTQTN